MSWASTTIGAMLDRAWARWDLVRGPVERERLSLYEDDFTAFRASERFAMVFIAVNTFLLTDDDPARVALLRAMREQLQPGGIAVIEVSTPGDDELADFDGRLQLEWLRHEPASGDLVAKLVSARHDAGDLQGDALPGLRVDASAWRPAGPRDPDRRSAPRLRTAPGRAGPGIGLRQGRICGGTIYPYPMVPEVTGPSSWPGWYSPGVATSEQIRLLLVEDVAQVSQYVRNLLQHQKQVRLLDTVTDGRVVLDRIRELRPDVLMVDALLQGKASGLEVAEQVRQAGLRIPIIIVTVPQKPVKVGEGMGIIEVLSMPFSGFELMNALNHASSRYRATAPSAMSRSYVVYSGKGGVGRTTIAYNLAVSFGQMPGVRVVLIDGDLQFSDLRGLLRVPDTAPSLLQLPDGPHLRERPGLRPVAGSLRHRPAAGAASRGAVRDGHGTRRGEGRLAAAAHLQRHRHRRAAGHHGHDAGVPRRR